MTSVGEEGLKDKKIELENFTNMVDYRVVNENRSRSKGRYNETPLSDRLYDNTP